MANESNAPAMTATMIILGLVSLAFMCLRFHCKRIMNADLGVDDYVLLFSWVLYLVYIILSIYTTRFGLGEHLINVDLVNDLPKALYFLPISQFFAVLSVAVSKSSFILTLLRLVVQPWQKAALWFMLATINASMLSIAIVQFYQCGAVPTAGCIAGDHVIGLGVFAAGYSAALDIVLSAFPSLVIWNLQMQKREKLGVIIAMSLGLIAGVVGIYKTTTIPNVARDSDFTFGTAIVLIWLVAEVTATIMAASIPFFRPLVRKFSSQAGPRKESYGMSSGMANRKGHNKLGSQVDVHNPTGGFDEESRSNKGILAPDGNTIVRKTEFSVEYDNSSSNEEDMGRGHRYV